MRIKPILCLLMFFFIHPLMAEEKKHGQMLGAKLSEAPEWFKESFLEFEEDVAEAAEDGKRVMLYFHQEGCPYCAKLIDESFNNPQSEAFIRQHFDGITLNIWGDREVVSVSGQDFTEKTFATALKVQYTPTLVFLDEQGKVVLRLNGYYPPEQFKTALNYVAERGEKRGSFADYALTRQEVTEGRLIDEDFFLPERHLDRLIDQQNGPLAVFFEAVDCVNCSILHRRILSDQATRKLVKSMDNVQLDIHSNAEITTPQGKTMPIKQWARSLGVDYTPSVVFFDQEGGEVMRISAFVKTFHFQSVFAYVLEKAYLQQPSFQRYISLRSERIREAGFNTDIWGYQSSHE